jgi:hypothetical protein
MIARAWTPFAGDLNDVGMSPRVLGVAAVDPMR